MSAEDKKKTEDQEKLEEEIEDQDDESEEPEETGDDDSKGSKKEKVFTQAQVSKMMAKEKKQGRNSVYNELGIDASDEKTISLFKAFAKSQKESEKEEKTPDVSGMEHRLMIAEAKAEAVIMGVRPQYVEDAITLVSSKLSKDSDLKTILGELKVKYPSWFGLAKDESDDNEGDNQNGTGSSLKNKNKSKDGQKSIGAKLAAQRVGGKKKGSFWG